MTDRERIEKACDALGLKIKGWKDDEDEGLTAQLGSFVVINDDWEERGLYSGSEGELSAVVVGAAQYGNQRVHFSLIEEGMDGGNEVPADVFSVLDYADGA